MNKKLTAHLCNSVLLIVLVVLDQLSKLWARTVLDGGNDISVIKGVFIFKFHKNTGAAWGIFRDSTSALTIVSIIIALLVVVFYLRIPSDSHKLKPLRIASVLVVSGAIGNIIDRIVFKYVTDFLYFELINFPIFNVADSYITVAMFLVILLFIFYYKDEDLAFLNFRKKNIDDSSMKKETDNV